MISESPAPPVESQTPLALVGEAARLVQRGLALPELLQQLSELIGHGLGFGTVAINLYRPAWNDLEVVAVHGNARAREELLGTTSTQESWSRLLEARFLRHGVYVIEKGDLAWDAVGVVTYVPQTRTRRRGDAAWDPEDALLVPLRSVNGRLVAIVSVDEPASGLRPGDEALELLSTVCAHAAIAIEQAQEAERREADRLALERLSRISPLLTARLSVGATLHAICEELRQALGFDRVAVQLADPETGLLHPAATAGWDPTDRALQTGLRTDALERLLAQTETLEGCVLMTTEAAQRIIGPPSPAMYVSRLNGRGPYAWNRHWLLAPLRAADGSLRGGIWVDDPLDRLVPSRERLQALRLFADQVATVLALAEQFDAIAQATEARSALIDAAPIAVIELDRQNVVRSWNRAAERIFGWRAHEAIGRRNPIVPADEWDAHLQRTRSVLAGGSIDAVRRRLRSDGSHVDIRLVATPITGSGGEVTGVAVLAEDISERVRAEEELRKTQEIHRRVIENTTDVISLIDRNGSIVFSTSARVLGYDDPDDPRWFAERIHPDDRERAQAALRAALAGAPPTLDEVRVRHADGSWRTFEGLAVCVRDDEGEPEFALAMTRDVTERRQLELELAQAQRLESIGRLTAGIAHDFNNLLTVMRGYTEVARSSLGDADAAAREPLDELQGAAERAARLTRQLLAFGRQQRLRPELLDLNAIVTETHRMLRPLLGGGIELSLQLAHDLRSCYADAGQLEQVVVNLALNGRDAMPDGGRLTLQTANVELDEQWASAHAGAVPGSYVMLAVSDTGTGMGDETISHVFEPFFTTKSGGNGNGLGLASVYGIVKQSGGAITVDSTIGEGTTFRIYLPQSTGWGSSSDATPQRDGAVAHDSDAGRKTILVVDDEDTVRSVTTIMLQTLGYRVLAAADAKEALELADRHGASVDLVLTDLVMPETSGFELARRLHETRPEIRVLFTSGYAHDVTGEYDGEVQLLEKPFGRDELAAAVEAALAR